jgi:hypothetical protein
MANENNRKVSVERERPFSPHHILLCAAKNALEIAENNSTMCEFSSITVITMSALAIEALCNSIGERVVKNWEDFESSSPKAKLRIICDELEIAYDSSVEPWSTAQWLMKIRNRLAHAKPQLVAESYDYGEEEYKKISWDKPESKLEKDLTIDNAKRAYKAIIELKFLLCKHVPDGKAFGLVGDMWFESSSVKQPESQKNNQVDCNE